MLDVRRLIPRHPRRGCGAGARRRRRITSKAGHDQPVVYRADTIRRSGRDLLRLPTPGDPIGTPTVLLHQFMGSLGNYDPVHQRRPNVVVDQSFAWITVDVRSVAIERG
jgi:pimeloyl-ACP methyl ester carboxylesterase